MLKIIVITDEQVDFTTGVLGNNECEATVPSVIRHLETGDYDIAVFTQDTHGSDYLNTQEGLRLPIPHCQESYPGWQIVPEIYKAAKASCKDIYIIKKPTFGSFALAELLKDLCAGIPEDQVEIHFVGVCTGICVITNVLITKTALPEARVCVIRDACACVTPQSHETALAAMATCQVDII